LADPFLDITAFKAEYQGTLTTGEQTTATRLLQVVSDGIRGLKPDVNTTAAQQVVFEVVRDAIMYGDLGLLSEFTNETSRRKESGKLDESAKMLDDYLTPRQKRYLGITAPITAGPRGYFPKCDY
jgi:hypothetical protein